jgi:hypothetical protein
LDPEGHPTPSATVDAESVPTGSELSSRETPPRGLRRRARTGEDGTFVFEGLTAGRWTLRAAREDLVSDRLEVELGQDEQRNGLFLELDRPTTIELLVTSNGVRPQAGVQVLAAVPPSSIGDAPEARRGVTDRRGIIAIERPEPPNLPVNLMLRAPSGLISAERLVLQEGASVDLSQAASELRIRIPRQEGAPSPWVFLISENGAYLNPRWAGPGITSDDGEAEWLVVPHLSDGQWKIVVPKTAEELFLVTSGRGLDLPTAAAVTLRGTPLTVDLSD